MINLAYAGELGTDNNSKTLLFQATFVGNYGVNGQGDTLNLAPFEQSTNVNGITDPELAYNQILAQAPKRVGLFSEDLGGSYVNPHNLAPAVATLLNSWALRMFEPGGAEKATGAAYTAAELAGSATIMINVPNQ